MNALHALLAPFSWRGRMARRAYLWQSVLASALFAAGGLLFARCEGAAAILLGCPQGAPHHGLLVLPLVAGLLPGVCSPFTLPAAFFILLMEHWLVPGERAAMVGAPPWLCLAAFAAANALMLGGGLRCAALAARRLRDAGSGMGVLGTLLGIYFIAHTLLSKLPCKQEALSLAALACLGCQCWLLLRPTQSTHPAP